MSDNLKPCPKCKSNNGQAVLSRRFSNRMNMSDFIIRCDDCGYELSGFVTEEAAIRAWNIEVEGSGKNNDKKKKHGE